MFTSHLNYLYVIWSFKSAELIGICPRTHSNPLMFEFISWWDFFKYDFNLKIIFALDLLFPATSFLLLLVTVSCKFLFLLCCTNDFCWFFNEFLLIFARFSYFLWVFARQFRKTGLRGFKPLIQVMYKKAIKKVVLIGFKFLINTACLCNVPLIGSNSGFYWLHKHNLSGSLFIVVVE